MVVRETTAGGCGAASPVHHGSQPLHVSSRPYHNRPVSKSHTHVVLLAVALAVLVVAVWQWGLGDGTHSTVTDPRGAGAEQESAAGKDASGDEQTHPAPEGKVDADRSKMAPDLESRAAHVIGRCVDGEGKPLSGCAISRTIHGRRPAPTTQGAAKARVDSWRIEPVVKNREDGSFDLSFWPLPEKGFALRFEAPGKASCFGSFPALSQAQVLDMGDVQMLPGARVRGRVMDSRGRPVSEVAPMFRMDADRQAALLARDSKVLPILGGGQSTDEAGRFVLWGALLAGEWNIDLDREILSSRKLVIPEGQKEVYVEIQVKAHEDCDHIQGFVVDARGVAVHRAKITWRTGSDRFVDQRRSWSKKDGSFWIFRSEKDGDAPVHVRIEKPGFETLEPEAALEWRSQGHRFVLAGSKILVIRAIDAVSGKPVEDFGVRIKALSERSDARRDFEVQDRGRHKGGELRVTGLDAGRYIVMVAPGKGHLASQWREVEPRGPDRPVVIKVDKAVQQELRVVSMRGTPIVGTRVELLEAEQGHPIDTNTWIDGRGGHFIGPNQARLWTEGRTGQDGTLTLVGPPGRELGLRILGPGHVPLYVNGVRLSPGKAPRRERVQIGATIFGRIRPLGVIRDLNALRAHITTQRGQDAVPHEPVGLRLRPNHKAVWMPPGSGDRLPIQQDGSFRITGLSPGTWEFQLVWTQASGAGRTTSNVGVDWIRNLRDGEEREVAVDVSRFQPGRVRAQVTWNGTPLRNRSLDLFAARDPRRSLRRGLYVTIPLDREGRFDRVLVPEIYTCRIKLASSDERGTMLRRALTVRPGQDAAVTIDFQTTALRLRLKNHEGTVMSGHAVYLLPAGQEQRIVLPPTDAKGESSKRVPSGLHRVLIRPKHLSTRKGFYEFRLLHPMDFEAAYAKAMIPLGTLQLSPGHEPDLRVLTVPEAAGY